MTKWMLVDVIYEFYKLIKMDDLMGTGEDKYMIQKVSDKESGGSKLPKFKYTKEVLGIPGENIKPGKTLILGDDRYFIEDIVEEQGPNKILYSDDPTQNIGDTYNYVITNQTTTHIDFMNPTDELVDFIFEKADEIIDEEYETPEFEI